MSMKLRAAGAAAAVLAIGVMLGCMSFSFEGRKEIVNSTDISYAQSGELTLTCGQVIDVYYPVPYASPPNLTLKKSSDDCCVIDQKPDHFRVQNNCGLTREVKWTARGMRTP